MKITFYELGNNRPEMKETMKMEAWKRSFGLTQDGSIFIPAYILGLEQIVLLNAEIEEIPVVTMYEHWFIPLTWARQVNKNKAYWDNIEKEIKRLVEEQDLLKDLNDAL